MNLHVYSTRCSWHGSIHSAGSIQTPPIKIKDKEIQSPGIPCCPFCKSVLYQTEDENWQKSAKEYESSGHLNYVDFLKWTEQQKQCWPTLKDAAEAFLKATGKIVILT